MNNTLEILANVNKLIEELEAISNKPYSEIIDKVDYDRHKCIRWDYKHDIKKYAFKIDAIFEELSIFDWWEETLSLSQLKQMRAFLVQAHKLGFDGYVCFKVGVTGCSHGMWAHKEESTTGYSPESDVLFHSFRCNEHNWDVCHNGVWLHDKETDGSRCHDYNLKQIKAELAV